MEFFLITLDAVQRAAQVKRIIRSQAKIGVEFDDDLAATFDSDDFCAGLFQHVQGAENQNG